MSGHAILGLVALNAWFLAVGSAVLFASRGWSEWGELARFSGVAYLLGLASLGIAWVWELSIGLRMGFSMVIGTGIVVAAGAVALGLALGRSVPSLHARQWSGPRISIVSAVFGALTVVYFAALFRSGRLAGLDEFDAWNFWVPKAKAIYYFGGFDPQFFRALGGPSYPPIVPTVDAAAFHFMGSSDVVTLHLQFWFLLVGFAAAVLGLLSGRAPAMFVWPPLLVLLVAPHVIGHALQPLADLTLDELFVVGTLCLTLWLLERRTWHLAAATLLLAGAMLTKREGYLYAASAIVAGLVVTWPGRRADWPRLIAVGLLAAAATMPWRILLALRDLPGGGPEAGGSGLFSHVDRAWPSLRLALDSMFDFGIWLVAAPLTLVAVILAFAAGARRLPTFVALLYAFAIVGFTWTSWAFPSVPLTTNPALNPIVRLTGEAALLIRAG